MSTVVARTENSHFFPRDRPKIISSDCKTPHLKKESWFWSDSDQFLEIENAIELAAEKNLIVLIVGETGTGKELVARKIHSQRVQKKYLSKVDSPFVAVNAGAMPEELAESLLFGHERGAFTSARERQYGKFEMARQGVLFLDEIQCLSPATQVKLLRVLQGKEFERLGSKETLPIQCQVVAATNIPLEILLEKKLFRKDLYFRLNICPIYLPPLRQRRDDLARISQGLLQRIREVYKTKAVEIDPAAFEILQRHEWPGNLRELEHALIFASLRTGDLITMEQLPRSLTGELTHFVQTGLWSV